ncbi:hypothetical protein SEUCBS139899_003665 [Sporothrix eucalyptigena]|uniref:60S ribosomal protein n=1 Tax=Sporothrix eucalyptigena TaxID=1812306 RepID=A0ABP0BRX9_9PEZI
MQSFSASATSATSRRFLTAAATSSSSSISSSAILSSSYCASPLIQHAPADRRYQSTANRTKRALNIAPHASFLKNGGGRDKFGVGSSSGSAGQVATTLGTVQSNGGTTTLLYNPPASAPSVYQTPFKFLPKSDPRRRSNLTALFQGSRQSSLAGFPADSSSPTSSPTAPELPHRNYAPTKKYHLSEEDVAEIRRLRAEDPIEWSVLRLAAKYECSPIFVMLVVRSSAEHRQAKQAEVAAARARWGPIRTKARADRMKRREMLYNGEL